MTAPALLALVHRGDVAEVAVRGHVAAVDAAGRVHASAGDAQAITTLRSTVKPLQALPFVDGGAADALGATVAERAIACASHEGAPEHVATVRSLLARAGLDEGMLSCGPQPPSNPAVLMALAAGGETPGRVHNNCSGKHAAMLCACAHAGWALEGYARRDHPLQREITARMSELAALDVGAAASGVDGCGLPTFGLPLATLARMFAAAAAARGGFARCQEAMASEPVMVAGRGRFDTALLSAFGGRLTAKSGGAAVWAAVARPAGVAVAIKLEAGAGEHLPPVAVAVLQQLDLLPAELPEELIPHAAGPLRNWAGDVVGGTTAAVRLRGG